MIRLKLERYNTLQFHFCTHQASNIIYQIVWRRVWMTRNKIECILIGKTSVSLFIYLITPVLGEENSIQFGIRGTFTKLFMHISSRNMFPTTRNVQIRVHVYHPRHCCGGWLTFGCFVPMIADHDLVKKGFGPMIANHDLVKKR